MMIFLIGMMAVVCVAVVCAMLVSAEATDDQIDERRAQRDEAEWG